MKTGVDDQACRGDHTMSTQENQAFVVYLSHGSQKFYDQTMFSVMTLLWLLIQNQRDDIRIVVYTDRADKAPQHPLVQVVEIAPETLKSYRGRFDYVHRIKHCVLLRASQELPGPMLYVDCDTRWLAIPDQALALLRQDKGSAMPPCCMHEIDGQFNETHFPDYHRYLTQCASELKEQGIVHLDRIVNWNAGAIGLGQGQTAFFEDALRLSDFLFTRVKPRNWVEQLAWSVVGCDRYQMFALGDCLHHYWNHSYEAPLYLRAFFESLPVGLSTEQLAQACATHAWNDQALKDLQSQTRHVWIRRWLKFKNSLRKRRIERLIQKESGA
jgi:hypothetical protein